MGNRIPESVINEISDRVNIQDIAGQYLTLSNKGGRLVGLCPFHTEKTPSFSVSPDKNAFYCFGCGKGGGLFQFVMEIEKLTFVEAVRFLATKAGIEIPDEESSGPDRKQKEAKLELYSRMATSFHHILMKTPAGSRAREYVSGRGINQETTETFLLGYAPGDPDWLFGFLKAKNYSTDFLAESGLFTKKRVDYPLFSNRLMFPIFNPAGQVVGFSGRDLGERGPKYINSPDSEIYHKGSLLYGFFQAAKEIRQQKRVVLCEGNVDVIALHQAGIKNAVAPLGTAFTEEQARLLKRYADKVIIAFDSDNAGRKATQKSGIISERFGFEIEVADFPRGKDPAELLQNEGAEILQKQVSGAVNFFDFLLKYRFESHDGNSDRKHAVVADLTEYIESVSSVIRRDLLLEKTADYLGLDRTSVRQEYLNLSRGLTGKTSVRNNVSLADGKLSQELYLMMCVMHHRPSMAEVRTEFSESDFMDPHARELFRILCDAEEERITDFDRLLQSVGDDALRNLLIRKIQTDEFRINAETIIAESIKSIRFRKLDQKSKDIEALLISMEKSGSETGTIQELMQEKNLIDREILKLKDVRR
jgi:DNA primase